MMDKTTTERRDPIALTLQDALNIYLPELRGATVEIWSDDDLAEEPAFVKISADLLAGDMTEDVLKEIEQHMDCEWCSGRVKHAALVILAEHKRLELFDRDVLYNRRPRTWRINGRVYVY